MRRRAADNWLLWLQRSNTCNYYESCYASQVPSTGGGATVEILVKCCLLSMANRDAADFPDAKRLLVPPLAMLTFPEPVAVTLATNIQRVIPLISGHTKTILLQARGCLLTTLMLLLVHASVPAEGKRITKVMQRWAGGCLLNPIPAYDRPSAPSSRQMVKREPLHQPHCLFPSCRAD